MSAIYFSSIDTLVFAGGGNRCWWQAGLLTRLLDHGAALPAQLVGTRAGAAIAASFMMGNTQAAPQVCKKMLADNTHLMDWRALCQLKLRFAHQATDRAWLGGCMNDSCFQAVRSSTQRVLVAVTRPAKAPSLDQAGSFLAGSLAYQAAIAPSVRGSVPPHSTPCASRQMIWPRPKASRLLDQATSWPNRARPW